MLKINLNGIWKLEMCGRDAEMMPEGGIDAKVPGSVYGAMLDGGLIPDPYYRDNELKVLPLMDNDFSYTTDVQVTKEMLSFDALRHFFLQMLDRIVNIQLLNASSFLSFPIFSYAATTASLTASSASCGFLIIHRANRYRSL